MAVFLRPRWSQCCMAKRSARERPSESCNCQRLKVLDHSDDLSSSGTSSKFTRKNYKQLQVDIRILASDSRFRHSTIRSNTFDTSRNPNGRQFAKREYQRCLRGLFAKVLFVPVFPSTIFHEQRFY